MATKRAKTLAFYLISFLIPIALLVITEFSLRAFDYGNTYPLFIESKAKKGYMQPNEEVINRFFALPTLAPNVSPDTQFFLKEKPTESFRIVVQGGSTAAGFPFGRWGSLSGMLQQRFKRLYPEKNIEIINTAMASVNSYTLLDFVDEIIAIEPDLILIYAGHNEYLGVMGVGSAFAAKGGRAATLLYLKMKELKLYQLVESTYYNLFGPDIQIQADERTLMAKVAKEKEIEYDSKLYHQGIEQFSGNLDLILSKYQQSNINVMVGTLASNEKDHIPFSAIDVVTPELIVRWGALSLEEKNKKIRNLEERIDKSESIDSAVHFELATHLLNVGNYEAAKAHFVAAKEKDKLRFRAPESFNTVIRDLTQKYDYSLVDVQDQIRADAQHGIIGSAHMLEHLHPSPRGYFLLSDAFVKQIVENQLIGKVQYQDKVAAWNEIPITKADLLYGEYKISRLTSDYPFRSSKIEVATPDYSSLEGEALEQRLNGESWLTINRQLNSKYQQIKDFKEAALIAGLLADALPDNTNLAFIAGLLYKKASNYPLSIYYFHKSLSENPNSINVNLSIAQSYFMLKEFDKSMRYLALVKDIKPDHPDIDKLINIVDKNR